MLARVWLLLALLAGLLAGPFPPRAAVAQLDPAVRDAVVRAAVQIALPVIISDERGDLRLPIPLGSGTVISPDGLVLTNQHVVDPTAQAALVERWERQIQAEFPDVSLRIAGSDFVLLGTDGSQPPTPLYAAEVATQDAELDLAVLRITDYADGERDGAPVAAVPFVAFGDSNTVLLGDRVQIFSYPAIGEDSLTYTTGVISGFIFDDAARERRWLSTDAVISGGSSGGTAISDAGDLIGIPTSGSELDCRPGDTNRDGVVDATDVGCIPTGGSLGRLIPVNLAAAFLATADLTGAAPAAVADVAADVAAAPAAPAVTPAPTAAPAAAPAGPPAAANVLFQEQFGPASGYLEVDEPDRSIALTDGALVITIKQPGSTTTYGLDGIVTDGEDVSFRAAIGETTGWGEILLTTRTADAAQWYFSVDPTAQTWSLYRDSTDTSELFYWVEPISYAGQVSDPLQTITVDLVNGQASLLLNDVDVVASAGVPMPDMSGALTFGFGAGVNPFSLSGSGQSFAVAFDQLELRRLD